MFHLKQKVVCINDDWTHPTWASVGTLPFHGGVYTIRKIIPVDWPNFGTAIAFHLDEIINRPYDFTHVGFMEVPFWATYFRPLVERKTDISVFTALLNTQKQTQDA